MLEVANPPAVVALLDAAAIGACPRVDGPRASPAVVDVLASLSPGAPARDEPLAVLVSAHVDLGAGVIRDKQGYSTTLRSANDLSLARVPPFPSQRSSVCCEN